MNNLTNRILKRYGLKSERTELSLADDVLRNVSELESLLPMALEIEREANGVYDEWMRLTDEVASVSEQILDLAEKINNLSDIDYLAEELSQSLINYKSAASDLGVEDLPPNIQEAQDLYDEYLDSDISVWLFQKGAEIEDAASVANKFIP